MIENSKFSTIDEELEYYLHVLDIQYLITQRLEASDYIGYVCVLIEPDEFSKKILLQELGFKQITHDFYYIEIENAEKLKVEKIEEIKLYYSNKFDIHKNNEIYRKNIKRLIKIWGKIRKVKYKINENFYLDENKGNGKPFFYYGKDYGYKFWDKIINLSTFIVLDAESLRIFVTDLYQAYYETLQNENSIKWIEKQIKKIYNITEKKEIKKKYIELINYDQFYFDIATLRNFYEHHRSEKEKDVNDQDIRNIFIRRINKIPINEYDY